MLGVGERVNGGQFSSIVSQARGLPVLLPVLTAGSCLPPQITAIISQSNGQNKQKGEGNQLRA